MSYKKIVFISSLILAMQQPIYAKENLVGIAIQSHPNILNIERFNSLEKWIKKIKIDGVVHVQNIGDVQLQKNQWAGTRNQNLSLEGFGLSMHASPVSLNVEYMCHLQDIGDTPWVASGYLCGTRGESRHLEGFAIRLTGKDSAYFSVKYQCRSQNEFDSRVVADGQFCGTRGESLALEGLKVWIEMRRM